MKKVNKLTIEEVCKYVSTCNEKDLYFVEKALYFNKEKQKSKMFEGSTKL